MGTSRLTLLVKELEYLAEQERKPWNELMRREKNGEEVSGEMIAEHYGSMVAYDWAATLLRKALE